jgi:hypothetical protein
MLSRSLYKLDDSSLACRCAQVRSKADDNNFDEILDDVLVNTCTDEEVAMFVDTALFCTNTLPSHRPSMAQVAKLLENHQSPRPSVGNDSIASSSHTLW